MSMSMSVSENFTVVKKGDTFQGIALENSISVSSLKKMNHIYGGGNSSLFVGQRLRVKEAKVPPSSSLLAEASRSKAVVNNILSKGSSSGSITWKESVQSLPPTTTTTAATTTTTTSVYDFIASSLWGSSARKKNGKLSTQSKSKTKTNKNASASDLSAGFRPRAGSGLGVEDLDTGEVIVTMPLTKSGDFTRAEPQADEVIVEPSSEAKKRNEYIKNAVLQPENTKSTFLSIEGQTLVDTEFDAELVEVNDNYFSPPTKKGTSPSNSPRGSKSPSSLNSKSKSPKGGGLRCRTRSFIKVQMSGDGCILSQAQAQALAFHLPAIYHANKWTLLYSVLNNGADLFSFYKLTKGANATIFVVETVDGDVFGGFAAEQWHVNSSFYGSGESFIFKAVDKKNVKVFKWSMENHFVMWSNDTQIGMGGGGDGFAFALDCDFYTGQSSRSATFNNDPLVSCVDQQQHSFQVKNVEVWKLESCI